MPTETECRSIEEFTLLTLGQVLQIQNIDNLALDTPVGQALLEANRAALKERRYLYDEPRDLLVDRQLGVDCVADNDIGNFECPDGSFADPGWRVVIGFDNFTDVATDARIREPFVRVFIWNIAFAVIVVALPVGHRPDAGHQLSRTAGSRGKKPSTGRS